MCQEGNNGCVYGSCINSTCVCDPEFAGTFCTLRWGMWMFEVPLGLFLLFLFLIACVAVQKPMLDYLVMDKWRAADFEFPRIAPDGALGWRKKIFKQYAGPDDLTPPFDTPLILLGILAIYAVSIVEYAQMILMPFTELVPWPNELAVVKFISRIALHGELEPQSSYFSHPLLQFWIGTGYFPCSVFLCLVLWLRRCPLLKPQPSYVPREDASTLVLHLSTEWLLIPIIIQCTLPWRCLISGYKASLRTYGPPDLLEECWSTDRLLRVGVGIAALSIYWPATFLLTIQFECDANYPTPLFLTHYAYMRDAIILKSLMAASYSIFGSTNAYVALGLQSMFSVYLAYQTLRMRPSIYALLNYIRGCFSVLVVWTCASALLALGLDDPTQPMSLWVWVGGASAIVVVSFVMYVRRWLQRRKSEKPAVLPPPEEKMSPVVASEPQALVEDSAPPPPVEDEEEEIKEEEKPKKKRRKRKKVNVSE